MKYKFSHYWLGFLIKVGIINRGRQNVVAKWWWTNRRKDAYKAEIEQRDRDTKRQESKPWRAG